MRANINNHFVYSPPNASSVEGFNKGNNFLETYLPTITLRPSAKAVLSNKINNKNWSNFLSINTGNSGISLVDVTPSSANVFNGSLTLSFKLQKGSNKSVNTKSMTISGFGKLNDQVSALKVIWTPNKVKLSDLLPSTLNINQVNNWLVGPQFSARIIGANSQETKIQKVQTNSLLGTIEIAYTVEVKFSSNPLDPTAVKTINFQPLTTTISGFLSYQKIVD